jgi:hypothetical protein
MPLLKGRSSTTTSLSPYQYKSLMTLRGNVLAHCLSREICCSWQARVLSSMEEKVVARANRWGGRTVTLSLSSVPWG